MKWLVPLYGAIGLLVSGAAWADDISHAHISCGGSLFEATTKEIDLAPYFQEITVLSGHDRHLIDLRERESPFPAELGRRFGFGFIVTAWQCRKTPIGFVLVLWYSCKDDLREHGPLPECNGPWEWERFVAPDGALLDAGYAINDPRYEALRQKLGYHDSPDRATDDGPFQDIH